MLPHLALIGFLIWIAFNIALAAWLTLITRAKKSAVRGGFR